jgi:hypothetical protein
MQIKKRAVTIRRVFIFEFLKESIVPLIKTFYSHQYKISEGGGDGDSGDSCAN